MSEPSVAIVEAVPTSGDVATDAVIDRFLERLARLSAADWGALDAVGERARGGWPHERWRRARRDTWPFAAPLPSLHRPAATAWFVAELVIDAMAAVDRAGEALEAAWRGRPRGAPAACPIPPRPPTSDDPRIARFRWESARLFDIVAGQPLGARAGYAVAAEAMVALRMRRSMANAAFLERYAPLEPFIPLASLGPF